MKKKLFLVISLLASILLISGCEDVIDLEIQNGETQLVVDAWLTDKDEQPEITLTLSQGYFDNSDIRPASGATVTIFEEDSTAHFFIEEGNTGKYIYSGEPFLKLGASYALAVEYNGETFFSLSQQRRVPAIDSVVFEAFTFPVTPPDEEFSSGFFAQFYAKDFEGVGDTYWIRFKKNNELINEPAAISIAYDASFSPGDGSDGLTFILPIRQSVNDGLYQHGDTVDVELWSITPEAYAFLFQVRQESSNGGIFSVPPANIPTNIVNFDSNSETQALGFFGVSSVSTFQAIADSTTANPQR